MILWEKCSPHYSMPISTVSGVQKMSFLLFLPSSSLPSPDHRDFFVILLPYLLRSFFSPFSFAFAIVLFHPFLIDFRLLVPKPGPAR